MSFKCVETTNLEMSSLWLSVESKKSPKEAQRKPIVEIYGKLFPPSTLHCELCDKVVHIKLYLTRHINSIMLLKVNKITIVLRVINRGRKGDNMKAADFCHSAKV